jgi:alkanesulfonate monooxygenase SsuD/methylene tetrahydromethanopterin reductase-like flavin-dependent oxidoreductase (luciferase family)
VGPVPAGDGPPLLIGGGGGHTNRRVVEYGAGWISGGGGPDAFAQGAAPIRQAWSDGGRSGAPRLIALGYYALGPDATALAEGYLTDYYAFAGPYAKMAAEAALTSEDVVREQLAAFAEAGCDELILFPCSPVVDQLRRLADVALS